MRNKLRNLARLFLLLLPAATLAPGRLLAADVDYELADPRLKAVTIDRHDAASYVAVRVDTAGRVFVGGRELLLVYEPDGRGGYLPRRELFRFPPESWLFDIEIRGHDLYVATASAIYVLPGAVVEREGIQARRLVWGQPRGHLQLGFYGLAWGPQGDLYLSMGDPLQHYGDFNRPDHWGHWTFFCQPEGTRLPYTGSGAVLRCRPDGTQLQVVAEGLFRPCGLAFDSQWNLFTNDNDREAMPVQYVPARLLHVTPYAYFGWPRGWMPSKTPDRLDLLETVFDAMGREAPAGLAYYDETDLPADYRHHLLMAGWARRVLVRYRPLPHGATFLADERPMLVSRSSARPVGVAVAADGRVFATILHMPHLESSPRAASELVMISSRDVSADRLPEAYDTATAAAEKLWDELSSSSWQRRLRAHVEILRRGGELFDEAQRKLRTIVEQQAHSPREPSQPGQPLAGDDPALPHLVWLAAASGSHEAADLLTRLANDPRAAVRLQAIRSLADHESLRAPSAVFAQALDDPEPRVRHAALAAFFRLDGPQPEQVALRLARDTDTYLRQTAARLLARRASFDELSALCRSDERSARLAGVLAAGFRLTMPPVNEALDDRLPLQPFDAAACIIQFADAQIDLRSLGRTGQFTTAEHWQTARTEDQERLFALLLAMLDDKDESVRLQAAHFLSLLNDVRSEPLVAKTLSAGEEARLAAVPVSAIKTIAEAWIVGPFADGSDGLKQAHPPEESAIDLGAEYSSPGGKLKWQRASAAYFDLSQLLGQQDHASCYAYFRLESAQRQRVLLFVGSNDGVKLWHNGRALWENPVVRRALAFQDAVLVDLQPGSNDLLVRVHNDTGDSGLLLHYKALGEVAAALPEKLDVATLAQRLKAAALAGDATRIPIELLEVDWNQAARAGDAQRGRKLFGPDGLGCAKCHATSAEQSVSGGPSLAEAPKRFTPSQLVESILLPSKSVSPAFRATLIATADGRTISGLVLGETADRLELLLSDSTRTTIPKSQIEDRQLQELSPMPSGLIRKSDELRDLLAYLLSDHP